MKMYTKSVQVLVANNINQSYKISMLSDITFCSSSFTSFSCSVLIANCPQVKFKK